MGWGVGVAVGTGVADAVAVAEGTGVAVGTGVDVWVEQGVRQLELFKCPRATADELKELALDSAKVYSPPRTGKKRPSGKSGRKKRPARGKKRTAPKK